MRACMDSELKASLRSGVEGEICGANEATPVR
jgi:hypothetical protein